MSSEKAALFVEFANLRNLLQHCNMLEVVTAVFPSKDLRFGMINGKRNPNFRFHICRIKVNMSAQSAT